MGNYNEEQRECPWCESSFSPIVEPYQGPHGMMKVSRCSNCGKIISARLEGEPENIHQKELVRENANGR